MASIVLIHGAWHGGWCFEQLIPLLERSGHNVIAPDLPGMGSGDATLSEWGDFAAHLCRAQSSPVILCGHSRGGIVISEAAERAPDAITALVYISAFLIRSGRSFIEEAATHPRSPDFEAAIEISSNQRVLSINADRARNIFYNETAPELAAAASARLVSEPSAPTFTPIWTSAKCYGRVPRYYVECTNDNALSLAHQRAMHSHEGCERVMTIDCDHSPFYSAPGELADIIIDVAEEVSSGRA